MPAVYAGYYDTHYPLPVIPPECNGVGNPLPVRTTRTGHCQPAAPALTAGDSTDATISIPDPLRFAPELVLIAASGGMTSM